MRDFNIKRILVPTDISEASRVELDYAVLFSDAFGGEIALFYADPTGVQFDLLTGAPIYLSGLADAEIAQIEKEVRVYADPSLKGRPYQVKIGIGDPVLSIANEARARAADLIVMATHGLRGWRRTALGSVTEGVVHGAPCPVLSIARSDRFPRLLVPGVTKIVCPINFSEVALESLQSAAKLAKSFGCELVIVHVVEPEEKGARVADEQRVRSWIGAEIQSSCTYREIVLRGGAAERILDCVEDIGADLLVIGAQQKLFRDETVIGTTTERLIRFARVPVLTVVRATKAAEKAA